MIYKFYNGSPDITERYVKNILPLISNIKEFEVFRNCEESPYLVIEDNERLRYTFILKDDMDNELWLYTLCGYHGSGPNATLKILQLLGVKEDYSICEEGMNHIKQRNVKPVHKLNLLTSQDKSIKYSDDIEEFHFLAEIDFKFAYQKSNFIKALESFGYLQHVTSVDKQFFAMAYVFDELDTPSPAYEYYYYTNNIIKFNQSFKDFSSEQIQIILEALTKHYGGEFKKKLIFNQGHVELLY